MDFQLTLHYAGQEICAPRHSFGPAVRTQYVLHYILSGKGLYRQGDAVYHLEANSVFLIRPGELTYYEADAEDPWEYCWIGFDGVHAAPLLELCGLAEIPARAVKSRQAAEILLTISKAQMTNRGNDILYTGLLYQLFSCLMEPSAPEQPTVSKAYWATAAEYIRKNYMYDITVSGVANFIGVDRSYLYRLFQVYQGQSPQNYLKQCRIEAARQLLSETPYSVTEIAYSCGFKDVATFGRAFRSLTGVTPSAFRTL